jgi:phosphoribosylformylglycinamidine (FGAM) synthase PurS component
MLRDVYSNEYVGHPHHAGHVSDVTEVEVGRVFYLQVETEVDGEHDEHEVKGIQDDGTKMYEYNFD